jgi:hypothetical protein
MSKKHRDRGVRSCRKLILTTAVLICLCSVLLSGCGVIPSVSVLPEDAAGNMPAASSGSVCDEETLYRDLYEGLCARKKTIAFDCDCSETVFDVFSRILADHPELFWFSGSASLTVKTSGTSVLLEFTPEVFITEQEIEIRSEKLEERAGEILSRCEKETELYERLLRLHDILVDETDYDSETARAVLGADPESNDGINQSSSAYGCLVNRQAICSGYAAAFQLLAGRLGAECRRVDGSEERSGAPHEWNLLCLDGEWYHVDVTWDDPVFSGEAADGYRTYDFFCVTTEEILRNHTVDDEEKLPDCTATEYSYYRRLGAVLDGYDADLIAEIIASQIHNDRIFLKFPDAETAEDAFARLLTDQEIFSVPAVAELGVRTVRGTVSDMGTVCLWITQ